MPHLKPFKIRLPDNVTVAAWFDQPVQQRAFKQSYRLQDARTPILKAGGSWLSVNSILTAVLVNLVACVHGSKILCELHSRGKIRSN